MKERGRERAWATGPCLPWRGGPANPLQEANIRIRRRPQCTRSLIFEETYEILIFKCHHLIFTCWPLNQTLRHSADEIQPAGVQVANSALEDIRPL